MDIASTQRLAAYTRDLGIDRAPAPNDSRAASTASARNTQTSKSADLSGVQVSLSTNAKALSEDGAASAPKHVSSRGGETDPLVQRQTEPTARESRSNRSLAIAAYQKIDSAISGRRIQVIA